jgi:hypothetical protein
MKTKISTFLKLLFVLKVCMLVGIQHFFKIVTGGLNSLKGKSHKIVSYNTIVNYR